MSVNAIGSSYQNTVREPAAIDNQGQTGGIAEINQLNAEIEQAEAEIKETMKEAQKAAAESSGGASEKAQMLQNKMLMQQQAIITKQMQIKKIESPTKPAIEQQSERASVQPRVDQYIAGETETNEPDNVYRLEKKDGVPTIIFNRLEESSSTI